jgi:hypothetical protein
LLGVIGRGTLVDQTGVWALGSALTGGAAFTALVILVPAGLGLAVGGRLEAPAGASTEEDDARPAVHRRGSVRSKPRG